MSLWSVNACMRIADEGKDCSFQISNQLLVHNSFKYFRQEGQVGDRTGRKLAGSDGSRPVFLMSGVICACSQDSGNTSKYSPSQYLRTGT